MRKRVFAVLGLGIFGSSIAESLSDFGYEVIGVDRDQKLVDALSDKITHAVQADFTDFEQLQEIGVQDVDVAVVASGLELESSVMAILHLKSMHVPYILAKAKNAAHRRVLLKIGADRVIQPEQEMGQRVAKSLLSQNMHEVIELDDEYSIVELEAPVHWLNTPLKELDLRRKYGVNILGRRKHEKGKLEMNVSPDDLIEQGDILLMLVEDRLFERLERKASAK